jgi:hypothetical protein
MPIRACLVFTFDRVGLDVAVLRIVPDELVVDGRGTGVGVVHGDVEAELPIFDVPAGQRARG